VTLFFSDIEGSTGLVHQLGAEVYAAVLARHRRVLAGEIAAAGGEVVECRADEFFAVFADPREAVAAAVAGQQAVAAEKWPQDAAVRVRMGLNAGVPTVLEGAYVGVDVNRTARLCSAGHGGQVLVSRTVRDALSVDTEFRDLGEYALAGLPHAERIFQLGGMRFPRLRASATTDHARRAPWRRRTNQPALGDIAWQVRSHVADVPPDVRSAVGQLGSRLFTGQRAIEQADGFLTRIDHARLAKRLADQRQMAAFVPTAERGAQAIQAQTTAVADAVTTRRTLVDYAAEAPTLLHNPTIVTRPQLDALRDRIATATAALDDAITRAAAAVDPLSFKLSRTRTRGVYRSGNRYLVPYTDNLGAERVRDFATRSEAHDFRQATLIAHAHTQRHSSDLSRLPPGTNPPTSS
jgi:class 3 adenylate cyclase